MQSFVSRPGLGTSDRNLIQYNNTAIHISDRRMDVRDGSTVESVVGSLRRCLIHTMG